MKPFKMKQNDKSGGLLDMSVGTFLRSLFLSKFIIKNAEGRFRTGKNI